MRPGDWSAVRGKVEGEVEAGADVQGFVGPSEDCE